MKNISQIFFIVGYFLTSFSPVFASQKMKKEEKEGKEESIEIINEDNTLKEFLRNKLKDNIKNNINNIPFFQIKFKEKDKKLRVIYVVGSKHDQSAEFLFPIEPFNVLKSLEGNARLITEHSSLYDHLLEKFIINNDEKAQGNSIIKERQDLLDSNALYNNKKPYDKKYYDEVWRKLKNVYFTSIGKNKPQNIKVETIDKLSLGPGSMLVYSFSLYETRKKIPGFESSLRNWKWQNDNDVDSLYLETPKDCLDPIYKNKMDTVDFFVKGLYLSGTLSSYNDDKETASGLIATKYKSEILSYNYENYKIYDKVIQSTIERNSPFAKSVCNIIDKTQDTPDTPLLIVCGLNHLRGYLVKESRSFLRLLKEELESRLSKEELELNSSLTFTRMKADGKWKDMD